MILKSRRPPKREDIVAASLSEIVMFFLFFCLILLGSIWAADGLKAGQYEAACEGGPQDCSPREELLPFLKICDDELPEGCVSKKEYDGISHVLAGIEERCGRGAENCSPHEPDGKGDDLLKRATALCGDDLSECQRIPPPPEPDPLLAGYKAKCGPIPENCTDIKALRKVEKILAGYAKRCGGDPDLCSKTPTVRAPETDLPASVFLEHGDGYTFTSGSYALSTEFEQTFRDGNAEEGITAGIKQVLDYLARSDVISSTRTAVIEVVGHTDEEPFGSRQTSNLDSGLVNFANGLSTQRLQAADNVGLGMVRAAAAAIFLRKELANTQFRHIKVIPLSAGQLQGKTFDLVSAYASDINKRDRQIDDESRRRIEIRVTSK